MNTTRGDQLIEQYLQRLAEATASLPAGERDDLIGDIREHITIALEEEGHPDETTIRNLLDRLGKPEDVVEAAYGDAQSPVAPRPAAVSGGGVEAAALLTLTLSPLVPGPGWIVGAALASASRRWSRYEKLVALGGVPLATVALVAALNFLPTYLPGAMIFDLAFALFPLGHVAMLLLAGPAGAAYLAWRQRIDAIEAPQVPAAGGPLAWAAVVALLLSWVIPLFGWVAAAVMVGVSSHWSRYEKLIGIVAIPLATVALAAVLFVLHLPGVDLPIDSPVTLPTTPGTVPLFTMGPAAAVYLAWRLVGRLRAHRTSSPRAEPA